MKDDDVQNEETKKDLRVYAVEQLKDGVSESNVSQKLVEKGMDAQGAAQLVESVRAQAMKEIREEQFTPSAIAPAILGGVLAAVVGGGIWGLIVILTGYEIGYMALGIGFLCGAAVVLFARGKRGLPLQIIAILSSILGIAIGKYFIFFHELKEIVKQDYGAEASSQVALFSVEVARYFIQNIGSMITFFDILWLVLAVGVAYRLPKGNKLKIAR